MQKDKDIFPQSAEELQKEAQSIRERREEEQEQAEIILHEFLTAAKEIKKICAARDKCTAECPLFDKEWHECTLNYNCYQIDTSVSPFEWVNGL